MTKLGPDMLLLIAVIGCLMAAISGQTTMTLPTLSEKLDDVHSMGNLTSDIGKKTVRLVNGTGRCSGMVQVKISGSWQPVCEDSWNNSASLSVCRELDCMGTEPTVSAVTPGPEGPEHLPVGNKSVVLNDTWGSPLPVVCHQGNWQSCQVQSNVCNSSRPAKINCTDFLSSNMSLISKTTSRPQLPTTESFVTIGMQKEECREWLLLIFCIILGILLLGSLTALTFIYLKAKGKYALPTMENHNQQTSTATLGGNNSYQEVSITSPKEEGRIPSTLKSEGLPRVSLQVRAPPSKDSDSDSDSDSDYERYDFHTQPPVPLSTFYNSQKHRVTEDMVQESKFRMPPLQEDPAVPAPQNYPRHDSESSTSSGEGYCNSPTSRLPQSNFPGFSSDRNHLLEQPPNLELAGSRATLPDASLLASQNSPRHNSESSTSSGEDYCNSPTSKLPPPIFQGFSSEKNIMEVPPNLELAGSQATLLGSHSRIVSAGPAAEDSSSTSSGECYENFGSAQEPPMASFVCPEPPTPAVTGSHEDDSSSEDYDDIGAS
ncbi:T-cell differentiation antigen CD6 isoform X2 [Trichosurus vulpecula]|uniref:T-cell differentiation antigen CD6 isoform X2 n=1 Tax=Trichosurus vulpecula TaxID=9337 RepID=UPI00186B06D7|nr:T-cell differentiation antigen CD6 isoform X2 [Trichosurus vulpecula]